MWTVLCDWVFVNCSRVDLCYFSTVSDRGAWYNQYSRKLQCKVFAVQMPHTGPFSCFLYALAESATSTDEKLLFVLYEVVVTELFRVENSREMTRALVVFWPQTRGR